MLVEVTFKQAHFLVWYKENKLGGGDVTPRDQEHDPVWMEQEGHSHEWALS